MSKYEKWYNSIINAAKNRMSPNIFEKHHILPKCLGGSNTNDNLVKLTSKEHFICHLLLTKMFTGDARKKMVFAFHMMRRGIRRDNQNERYRVSARTFPVLQEEFKEYLRQRTVSAETRAKISVANKGKMPHNTGKQLSSETRAKIGVKSKGRIKSPETREKLAWARGKKQTPEHIAKRALANTGKTRSLEHTAKISAKRQKPCTIDNGITIYPSQKALMEVHGRGKSGRHHPNFKYVTEIS